jgi:hypothetical protein
MTSEKIKVLEEAGYFLRGHFPLPEACWLENYYALLEQAFQDFLKRHDTQEASDIVDAERAEIALYKKHHAHYSYGFSFISLRWLTNPACCNTFNLNGGRTILPP